MQVRVILVDVNPKMVAAWRSSFEENPEVEIVHGSMLEQTAHAWVTPTNARGSMDGGLDAVLKKHLGAQIERRVQAEIGRLYGGQMPVGCATCVPTGRDLPRFLISTPTMSASSEDISDTLNVALACAAAFQAVHRRNGQEPGSIRSVALPGLGANTGRVPVEICADLMWTGYSLFLAHEYTDFAEMRRALEEQLGDLGPISTAAEPKGPMHPPKSAPPKPGWTKPQAAPPSVKTEDVDFDDSE